MRNAVAAVLFALGGCYIEVHNPPVAAPVPAVAAVAEIQCDSQPDGQTASSSESETVVADTSEVEDRSDEARQRAEEAAERAEEAVERAAEAGERAAEAGERAAEEAEASIERAESEIDSALDRSCADGDGDSD